MITANQMPGADTIAFAINAANDPRCNSTTAICTINPITVLPTISDPVTIDGYTQPGAIPNTNPSSIGSNGVLKIELDGNGTAQIQNPGWALRINGGNTVVRGLVLNRFAGIAIWIETNGNNVIEGNFTGTDPNGQLRAANDYGVYIYESSNNTVGGFLPASRNVISGNWYSGVYVAGATPSDNVVAGNIIGLNASGTAKLGMTTGVVLSGSGNRVGGLSPGAKNIISGNNNGIWIAGGNSSGNLIQGNAIGTNPAGTVALGNTGTGVYISGAPGNTVGGSAPGAGNVISGNADGLHIGNEEATGNIVQGNLIGTDATGNQRLGNTNRGVQIGSSANTIGGSSSGEGNIISGNYIGLLIGPGGASSIPRDNVVMGNMIGTNANRSTNLGNSTSGISLWTARNNSIGGPLTGAGNVISGNGWAGIELDTDSTGNRIRGNSIYSNGGPGIGGATSAVPVILGGGSAWGTACANCVVDVYSDRADQGQFYHGFSIADGAGNWTFSGSVSGPNITATATDLSGTTSGFSAYPLCGSNPSSTSSIPERLDGTFAGTDDDGDTQVDEPLPGGAAAYDCDGDGFTGTAEDHVYSGIGGRDQDPCGNNGWPGDLYPFAPSVNKLTLLDLSSFIAPPPRKLNTSPGNTGYDVRWDLTPGAPAGKHINLLDVSALTAPAPPTANPPMFGGQRAFDGPDCPWPP